jgi:dihydroorotate dehydrogenase electron transfer subunit
LVTDLLPQQLARGDLQAVCTCGPRPMMAVVARLAAAAGYPCYASLEQWMGCGVGACLGCAVPAVGAQQYVRVCKDGPVFPAAMIDWGALVPSPPTPLPCGRRRPRGEGSQTTAGGEGHD